MKKIINYNDAIALLKSGYAIIDTPIGGTMYIDVDDIRYIIRLDTFTKIIKNNNLKSGLYQNWCTQYTLHNSECK